MGIEASGSRVGSRAAGALGCVRLTPILALAAVLLIAIACGLSAKVSTARAAEPAHNCKIHGPKEEPQGGEAEGEYPPSALEEPPGLIKRPISMPLAYYVRCEGGQGGHPKYECTAEVAECPQANYDTTPLKHTTRKLQSYQNFWWGCTQAQCDRKEWLYADYVKHHRARRRRLGEVRGSSPGEGEGEEPECGDPVHCATGNLTESETDLTLGGRGVPFSFARTYNSESIGLEGGPNGRPFGYGWSATFFDFLSANAGSAQVTVVQADGRTVDFSGYEPGVEGSLRPPLWSRDKLFEEHDGSFLFTLPDQVSYHFSGSGRLLSEKDRFGNETKLEYNAKSQLTTVEDAVGRQLSLAYNGQGRVESVTDPMGHVAKYTYDSEGNLKTVTEPGESESSPRWQFGYNTKHCMTERVEDARSKTTNECDELNRVTSQTDAMGNTLKFTYEATGGYFEGVLRTPAETQQEEEEEEWTAGEEQELAEEGAPIPPSPPEFMTTITNEATHAVTLEHFNSEYQLTSVTRGLGSAQPTTETFTYWPAIDRLKTRLDGDNHETKYEYDSTGDLESKTDALHHTTTWHYDRFHDVTSEETPNEHLTTVKRNESTGAAEEVKRAAPHSETQITKYAYGEHGEVKTMTDPLGHEWTYEYKDPYGDRTAEIDPITPVGNKRTFAYNKDSQLVSTTAPSGNAPKAAPVPSTTTIERDAQGRPVAVTEPPEGFLMKSALPGSFSSASAVAVDSEGHVWVGRLSSGAVEEFSTSGEFIRALPTTFGPSCEGSLAETAGLAVDKQNRLWVSDRKRNRVLRFSAEGSCELEIGAKEGKEGSGNGEFKGPQGIAVANGYVWVLDSCNNRVQKFSEAGTWEGKFSAGTCAKNPWGIAVDSRGHVWISQMLGIEALREYTESGQFVQTVRSPNSGNEYSWGSGLAPSPGGGVYVAYWNGARVERYGPEGEYLQRFGSCCEGAGHFQWATGLAMASDGSFWLSEQRYGRVEHWEAFASKTTYKYEPNGNLETVTNPDGHTAKYEYNKDNQLERVIQPNGAEQKTEYDGAGQVVAQIDGNNHKTEYKRNALGEVVAVVDPLSRKTVKHYDNAGNLKSVSYPGHSELEPNVQYEYDADNRLREVKYPASTTPTVTYEYDGDGNRTEMTDGTGTTKYTYDVLDRLEQAEDKRSSSGPIETVKYEYNLANELTKLTYPNNREVKRTYDNAGRLHSVEDWLSNTTSFNYNEDSALTSTVFPTATGEEDKYFNDGADRMNEASFRKGSTTLASVAYSRDPEGNITTTVTSQLPEEGTALYTYDTNARLASAGPPGTATGYEYDNANNLTKIGSTEQHFDEADELKESGSTKYSYSELGERKETSPASGPHTTYGYNEGEELTSVSRPEAPTIEDAYNGEGLVSSQVGTGTTSYLSWGEWEGLPLLLRDGVNSYIYGADGLPLEQINNGTGAVAYLHHDQAGSTRLMTGTSGAVEGTFGYGPYGNLTGATGIATTPLGYDGEYTSPDTGLQYLRERNYDPATGQFTSVDPIAALTREPYSFAGDNPLIYSDPLGLDFGDELESSGEEVGEAVTGFGDEAANTVTFGAEPNKWIREELGLAQPDFCSSNYRAGKITGGIYATLIPIERIPSLVRFIREGREIKIGENWRFAPFGNRRGGTGRFPHYHRRGEGPGQGIGRHRPWETRPGDESWWERF
jgi:RHS repeat-associated protein